MIIRTSLLSLTFLGISLLPSFGSLVAYYPLDGDFNNASGNGNDGIFFGGTSYSTSVAAALGGGMSVQFDGVAGTYGSIDDFAVWDQGLTAGQIASLAGGASPLSVPEPSTALLGMGGLLFLALRRRR
jgi:hypothetical protein